MDPARQRIGTVPGHSGRHQRPRHQPARVRQPELLAPEGKRHDPARLVHARTARLDEAQDTLVELVRDDVVRGEDDLRAAREGGLGHDVDRGRLELDEVHLRVDALELLAQRVPPREIARDVDDLGVEPVGRRGPGREDGGAAATERLGRAQPKLGRDDRDVRDRADRLAVRPAGVDDEVGDENAIRVEAGARVVPAVRDEDPRVHVDRRQRGAAAVEYEQLRVELRGEPRASRTFE